MFMMNFLEASHFKIASVLSKLECQPKLEHKFAKYIETQRDKQVTKTDHFCKLNLTSFLVCWLCLTFRSWMQFNRFLKMISEIV